MIVWVFFEAGSGGDGVANLLEHSSNAVTIDGELKWRIHRYVDCKVKFWAPNLPGVPDRRNTVAQLSEEHIKIANKDDQYIIVTSHDLQLKNTFLNSTIPKEKHIKLLLTFDNFVKQQVNFNTKNLIEFDRSQLKIHRQMRHGPMDFVLDVDRITDWKYTKDIVSKIGLQLAQEKFEHYKQIVDGKVKYTTPGIEYYKSYIDTDGIVKYSKIN